MLFAPARRCCRFILLISKVADAIRSCGEVRIVFGCYSLNSCSNPVMTMNRMAVMPMASIMVDLLCLVNKTRLSPNGSLVDDSGRQGDVCRRQYHCLAGPDLFDQVWLEADDEAVFTGTCTGDVVDVFDAQAHVLAKVALQLRGEDQPYPIHKGWRCTEL